MERDLQVSKGHQVLLEQLVKLVLLDSLETLVQPVQMVQLVLLEQQEHLVAMEEPVQQALQGQ